MGTRSVHVIRVRVRIRVRIRVRVRVRVRIRAHLFPCFSLHTMPHLGSSPVYAFHSLKGKIRVRI